MKFHLVTALILSFCSLPAKDKILDDLLKNYEPVTWKSPREGTFNYRYCAPANIKKNAKYPLLVFFHGAGGRGDDNSRQLVDAGGIKAFEKEGLRTKRQSYLFAGQVPKGERWVDVHWNLLGHRMPKVPSDSMRMALEALDAFVSDKKNQVDPNRIYVMGLSMGGYGTWDAIQRRPDFFAAAVPICGGGDKRLGGKISKLPIWAWHGDKDTVIKPSRSREMIEAIREAGGKPKYSEIKGRGHNSWTDTWNSADLWNWLYSQKRK
jgi:predicted peptidase